MRRNIVEAKVCECPRPLCKYKWVARGDNTPKECPSCKHRFDTAWGLPVKCEKIKIHSMDDFKKLKADIASWNKEERFK